MRSFVTDVSNQTQRQTVHQLTLTSVCVGLVIHIKGHCNSGVQKQEVVSLVSLVISSFRSFHFFFSLAETGRWLGRLFWGFWGFWLPSAPQPPSGGGDGDESSKTNKRLCVTVSWRRLLQENDRKWKWQEMKVNTSPCDSAVRDIKTKSRTRLWFWSTDVQVLVDGVGCELC